MYFLFISNLPFFSIKFNLYLIDYIDSEYGIKLEKYKVVNIAKEKELYYDAIMEKIYIDYDEYFEEV